MKLDIWKNKEVPSLTKEVGISMGFARKIALAIGAWVFAIGLSPLVVLGQGSSFEFHQKPEPPPKPVSQPRSRPGLKPFLIPPIVAIVNGVKLTGREFEKELNRLIPQKFYHAKVPADKLGEMRSAALQSLIDKELKYQEGRRLEIKIDRKEIMAEVRRAIAEGSKSERARYQGKEEQMYRKYKQIIERRLLILKVEEQAVPKEIKIEPKFVAAEYERNLDSYRYPDQVFLQHIFFEVSPSSSGDEVRARKEEALKAWQQITDGVPFKEVAGRVSDGIYKARGGDVGWVAAADIIQPEVASRAFELKVNILSEVIKSLYGYHIIRIVDVKNGAMKSFAEAAEDIRVRLTQARVMAMRREWLQKLRSGSEVNRLLKL